MGNQWGWVPAVLQAEVIVNSYFRCLNFCNCNSWPAWYEREILFPFVEHLNYWAVCMYVCVYYHHGQSTQCLAITVRVGFDQKHAGARNTDIQIQSLDARSPHIHTYGHTDDSRQHASHGCRIPLPLTQVSVGRSSSLDRLQPWPFGRMGRGAVRWRQVVHCWAASRPGSRTVASLSRAASVGGGSGDPAEWTSLARHCC